ncbi:MAG: ATP-binding protein [Bacteroidota bacterium]
MEQLLFTGRDYERKLLTELVTKPGAELVSITGRRRVGKTFLVKQTLAEHGIDFMTSGLQDGSMREQMIAFEFSLASAADREPSVAGFASWQVAFIRLIGHLKTIRKSGKLIVFLDELPWLATPRSGFLRAFSFFWNNWAVDQNILVVICGSAASWMIQKVVNDRGGLHNRITKRIQLHPFTLQETQQYLEARGVNYPPIAILEIYLALGGVPYYLREIQVGKTPAENINACCFATAGNLRNEFSNLYPALFARSTRHVAIVRALAKHPYGLGRAELTKLTGLSDGGSLTKALQELEFSGFVLHQRPFGRKKRGGIYRLVDAYSLFYLRFIEPNQGALPDWTDLRRRQAYSVWAGYAFENVGIRHLPQLKAALGIAAVSTVASTFYASGSNTAGGAQIDLVLQRADHAIHLCDFKHYNAPLRLTKQQLSRLAEQKAVFQTTTGTNDVLFTTLITTYGLHAPERAAGVIDQVVTLEDLFG